MYHLASKEQGRKYEFKYGFSLVYKTFKNKKALNFTRY